MRWSEISSHGEAKEAVCVGKISGAGGTFAHIPPFIEEFVCRSLDSTSAHLDTNCSEDHHAEFFTTLAIMASSIEKFSVELSTSSEPRFWKLRNFFPRGRRGHLPCRIRGIHLFRKPFRSGTSYAILQFGGFGKHSLCTSVISAIPRWKGWSLRMPRYWSTNMLNRLTSLVENLIVYPENMKTIWKRWEVSFFRNRSFSIWPKKASRGKKHMEWFRECDESWEKGRGFQNPSLTGWDIKRLMTQKELDTLLMSGLTWSTQRISYEESLEILKMKKDQKPSMTWEIFSGSKNLQIEAGRNPFLKRPPSLRSGILWSPYHCPGPPELPLDKKDWGSDSLQWI